MRRTLMAALLVIAGGRAPATVPDHPVPESAAFAVRYRGLVTSRPLNPLFARSGESIRIVADGVTSSSLDAAAGVVAGDGAGAWRWTAPREAGPVLLTVRAAGGDSIRIQALVSVPATEVRDGRLRGYRIGAYPVNDGSPARPRAPSAFIQVTPELRTLRISQRLRLGQFVCKQESGWPRFVVLDERLVLALEDLADGLVARGLPGTLTIMSGYRTPFYNAGLGNVRNSRHIYGQAADVYVDVHPADGRMDDLNADGRSDRRDADRLAELVNQILAGTSMEFPGGIGRYGPNASHGPFVHVDVRGFRARW